MDKTSIGSDASCGPCCAGAAAVAAPKATQDMPRGPSHDDCQRDAAHDDEAEAAGCGNVCDGPGHHHDHHDHDHDHDHHHQAAPIDTSVPPGAVLFRIADMDCAAEESEIRRALSAVDGITALQFRLGQRTLAITAGPEAVEHAVQAMRGAGFEPQPVPTADAAQATVPPLRSELPRLIASLVLALLAEGLAWTSMAGTATGHAVEMLVAAAAIALAGAQTYRKGLAALRHGRLNINALMAVAVTGAFLIGQWPEAAMVMALYAVAEWIEARSVDRARGAIQNLMAMSPDDAEVRQPDGRWQSVPVGGVTVGSVVRIKPGQRVPLDGRVQAGRGAVNQAPVTGESIPVDKAPGDAVYAGTINQEGELTVEVSATAQHSTLARIIHAVEQAQGSRAPTQRFVDRFAAVYTPAVFLLALSVALLTPWLLGWAWSAAVYKALVLLVIACPCALVIATPVTVVSALATAARHGVLVKGGVHLEKARGLRAVALDKTGTLTWGQARLVETAVLAGDGEQALVWAEALASRSNHPVSAAIAKGLAHQRAPEGQGCAAGIHGTLVADMRALPGQGISALVDGQPLLLTHWAALRERGLGHAAIESQVSSQQAQGRTVTLLATPERVLALFAVADTVRDTAREAVDGLHRLGVQTVMLTGDHALTAQAIAQQVGVKDQRAGLMPQDKFDAIEQLRREHGMTAMVGDGINDAPALARSDLGVAMGAIGTDTAMEAADVVIMNDDLRRLPALVRLSAATHRVLWQNIAIALGIKAVFLALAIGGEATMWMAVFADMGASLLVVANGLRLLRARFTPS